MEKTLNNFFINENVDINLESFIYNLIAVVLLTYLIKLVYNKYSQSLSNKDYFSKNFVVLGVTTCIVITIVKSSLALSLGLVGALSIVRFRTPIKVVADQDARAPRKRHNAVAHHLTRAIIRRTPFMYKIALYYTYLTGISTPCIHTVYTRE